MYVSTNTLHTSTQDFQISTSFYFDENNCWIILSNLIPWDEFFNGNTQVYLMKKVVHQQNHLDVLWVHY